MHLYINSHQLNASAYGIPLYGAEMPDLPGVLALRIQAVLLLPLPYYSLFQISVLTTSHALLIRHLGETL